MASLRFEGTRVGIEEGDSVASALYRHGVRTFTRSLKYHRRRGLYCLTGDCPNCMINIDGQPGCRACITRARDGSIVRRESGFPSAERDVLAIADRAHVLMPVGFYYKTFIHPRFAWRLAEKVIRRLTGVGALPAAGVPARKVTRHARADVLVIGGGVAGLAVAQSAAAGGQSVIVCDEGRLGEKLPPGPALDAVRELADALAGDARVTVLDGHVAVGIYEGPLVPLVGPAGTVRVDPGRVIVATGAVESHAVFAGNDLPGVWLGRGAGRMAGAHGIAPGSRAVVVAAAHTSVRETVDLIATLQGAGVAVVAALAHQPLLSGLPPGVEAIADGTIVAAKGRRHLTSVLVSGPFGRRRIACDALVLSLGYAPRDGLLRMSGDLPVTAAGEVVLPGCSLEEAIASGSAAGEGRPAGEPPELETVDRGADGYVCLCQDVSVADLRRAWDEGWRSSEILKRYTTATMGPCQAQLCGRYLAAFAAGKERAAFAAGARTTARPPARPVLLEDLAAGVHEVLEKRTALHDAHRSAGARLDWSGGWMRPYGYADLESEYAAVRHRVSLMDVSTLGKFLIGGRDARRLVDGVFTCDVEDLVPGRSRYALALDEAGYVMDDGLICALPDGRYYLTSTSGGADRMEAWLRHWADRWDLHVHLVNQTSMLGAINVAGPRARELLSRLCDEPIGSDTIPYRGHANINVGGVPSRAIRVGFVGELSFELHHARSRSVQLWSDLMEAGADLDIAPHGLDALDVLRLEKGHIYLGQDTLPDDHPRKLGMDWAVGTGKGSFVGDTALRRMADLPLERKLVGLSFDAPPERGAPLVAGGGIVGRVTSCARSPVLERHIGLGWLRAVNGEFPTDLVAGEARARVVPTPFYDPKGERLRA